MTELEIKAIAFDALSEAINDDELTDEERAGYNHGILAMTELIVKRLSEEAEKEPVELAVKVVPVPVAVPDQPEITEEQKKEINELADKIFADEEPAPAKKRGRKPKKEVIADV